MKVNKIGYFFSVKYIEKNIKTHRLVLEVVKNLGLSMYKSDLIENYPNSLKKIKEEDNPLIGGTQKQIRNIDFAIAFFSDKSRLVFMQTIVALENKTPVLCIVKEESYGDFPEAILSYGSEYIQVRKYKSINEIEAIIREYVEDLEPPKRRFNVVLKTKTLKQMEQLTRTLDTTKAELIRRLVDKEYRRIFP